MPLIHYPVSLDTEIQNMFPVAELSNLNSADYSFLDEICTPEDYQNTEIQNMSDLNYVKGNSFTETNALSADWLSGNIGLDTLSGELSFPQSTPTAQNRVFYPSTSDASLTSCSEAAIESSDMFGIDSQIDVSIFAERLSSEEKIYRSSDELIGRQTDALHVMSPLVSENEEVTVEQNNKEDDYSLAGKKYLKMRQMNNVASQRSRKLRKQKDLEMVERLKKLEKENKELTMLAEKLEKQRDALQRQLLQRISKK